MSFVVCWQFRRLHSLHCVHNSIASCLSLGLVLALTVDFRRWPLCFFSLLDSLPESYNLVSLQVELPPELLPQLLMLLRDVFLGTTICLCFFKEGLVAKWAIRIGDVLLPPPEILLGPLHQAARVEDVFALCLADFGGQLVELATYGADLVRALRACALLQWPGRLVLDLVVEAIPLALEVLVWIFNFIWPGSCGLRRRRLDSVLQRSQNCFRDFELGHRRLLRDLDERERAQALLESLDLLLLLELLLILFQQELVDVLLGQKVHPAQPDLPQADIAILVVVRRTREYLRLVQVLSIPCRLAGLTGLLICQT